jgi:hypothetical protein
MVSDKISLIYARETVNNIPNNSAGTITVNDARLIYKEFSNKNSSVGVNLNSVSLACLTPAQFKNAAECSNMKLYQISSVSVNVNGSNFMISFDDIFKKYKAPISNLYYNEIQAILDTLNQMYLPKYNELVNIWDKLYTDVYIQVEEDANGNLTMQYIDCGYIQGLFGINNVTYIKNGATYTKNAKDALIDLFDNL